MSLRRQKVCQGFRRLSFQISYYRGYSHEHGAKFEKVIVLGILHFNNSPGVKTTTDLLPFHLNQLVGANHSKGNACLGKTDKGPQRETKSEKDIWKVTQKIKASRRRGCTEWKQRWIGREWYMSQEPEEENIWHSLIKADFSCVPLLPSGLWSAPWTPHPRQSRRRVADKFWCRALRSRPGSDSGNKRNP